MLKIGIIGLGVGEQHLLAFDAHPDCAVTAICDFDRQKLAEVSARFPKVLTFSEDKHILEDPEIDVVSIASFDQFHCAQVVSALCNGKHVFVEKPICLSAEELEKIKKASLEAPDLLISSNLILRKAPRFRQLRRDIRNNRLGEIYSIEGDYNYGRLHKIISGWRAEAEFHSVVYGGAIHLIDLMLWLSEDAVVEASAFGTGIATKDTSFKFHDAVTAILRFKSGAIGKVAANYSCVFPHFHNLNVYGTKASFVQNHLGGAAIYSSRDPDISPDLVESAYPGARKGDMIPSFINAVLKGKDPEVTKDEVFRAMEVAIAIENAAGSGAVIKLSQ